VFLLYSRTNLNLMKKILLIITAATILVCCKSTSEMKTTGSVEKLDPSLESLINNDAKIEVLAEGYKWSEGPVWIESEKMLLYSDVPMNTIYKWTEKNGAQVFLTPSGYTGETPSASREPGSNGLTLDNKGKLILCQHGDRRVARLESSFQDPKPNYITIADLFEGKRFSSPNDAVVRKNGDIFFTDPPYGLPNQENDSTKEIPFNGVYKVSTSGAVTMLVDSLTRPNGIAFTPDEKTVIVANSDPGKARWYAYELSENDSVINARILYDATENTKTEKGLPDGLKIDKQGNIFATGPGGIWIFNKEGKLIGKIKLPEPTANCALADDDKTLYITSNMFLLRIKMR
jgi:gluconolactonase